MGKPGQESPLARASICFFLHALYYMFPQSCPVILTSFLEKRRILCAHFDMFFISCIPLPFMKQLKNILSRATCSIRAIAPQGIVTPQEPECDSSD